MRSDSLRRTAAAATELLNANHEMKARAAPQRTRGMVNTSHGRVKETPLDCKRTLPRAYSSGVSARPRPPRHARSGPNSPPLRDVPASGAARPTGLDMQNHRWRGARAAKPIQSPHFFATDRPKAAPGVHLAPALLPNPWPRTPHAAFLRHTSKRAAKRPRFGDTAPATEKRPETMNKFGAQPWAARS